MKRMTTLNFEDNDIKSYMEDEILVINVKKNAFEIGSDLSESAYLFEIIDLAERSAQVKAVFLYNEHGCFSESEYEAFLRKVFKIDNNTTEPKFNDIADQSLRIRQINILNHFISQVINFKKVFVFGLQGCVVTPFMGASLAADLRFATEDTEFSFAHLKYGLHPTGALPLLLPRFVGLSRAKYLLFRGGRITASEAVGMQLFNKVFEKNNFREACLKEIREIIQYDNETLSITKKLFHINPEELQNYFHYETQNTVLK